MASKEVMVVTEDDIKDKLQLGAHEIETLKFLVAHAGIEMDEEQEAEFIAQRALRMNEIREVKELQAWCERTAASCKEALKHTFNIGDADSLPPGASWNKQSYTYAWSNEDAPRFVAEELIASNLVTAGRIFYELKPEQIVKAAGITMEKLIELFKDAVVAKPKDRTLKIK
jgi:hypothetical protein